MLLSIAFPHVIHDNGNHMQQFFIFLYNLDEEDAGRMKI